MMSMAVILKASIYNSWLFMNSILKFLNILPFSRSGQEILTGMHKRKVWTKTSKKQKKLINHYYSRDDWLKKIIHDFTCFLFLGVLSYTASNIINHTYYPILNSIMKASSLLMVKCKHKDDKMIGLWIQCININKHVPFKIFIKVMKDIVPVLSKSWCLSCWLIMYDKNYNENGVICWWKFSQWYTDGSWYNANICNNLRGRVFEDFFVTAHQDRWNLVYSLKAYYNQHEKLLEVFIFGGGIPLPHDSATGAPRSLSVSINFIETWLKALSSNSSWSFCAYQ